MTADQGAREARYAESIHRHTCGDGECCCWEEEITPCAEVDLTGFVRAFLPLVDAEVAAAVSEAQAEIERNATAAEAAIDHANLRRMTAEAEVERLTADLENWKRCYRESEAEVERLQGGIATLAGEWGRFEHIGSHLWAAHAAELAALLTPSPAATTGEAGDLASLTAKFEALKPQVEAEIERRKITRTCGTCGSDGEPYEAKDGSTCPNPFHTAPVSSGEAGKGEHEACARRVENGAIHYACGVTIEVGTPDAYAVHVSEWHSSPAPVVTPSAAPVHFLTEYGTTRCPVEGVAANADDEDGVLICSACGGVVTPSAEDGQS